MEKYELTAGGKDCGKRLDVFLVERFEGRFSRSFIKKVFDLKKICVNGKAEKAHHIVREGDEVTVKMEEPTHPTAKPENIPVDIVYEDDDVIVVNKPAGLVVHPAPGNYEGTLVNALLYRCKGLSGIGGELRPGIVHRLDKDTSGLIVVAKSDRAYRSLQAQLKKREAGRTYLALVKGIVQLDNGIIDMPIGRNPSDRKRMDVNYLDSRDAVTRYKVVRRFEDFTMLELKLETGRTHQIRVHLKHLGYPVLGDATYGIKKGIERQALHAVRLSFTHPKTREPMEFESPIPEDMMAVINRGKI